MLDSSITPAAHVLHMYMTSAVRQHECVQHAYNIFVRAASLVHKSKLNPKCNELVHYKVSSRIFFLCVCCVWVGG